MARPKSEDKRSAIVAAAIRVIVQQGLSAPTAVIAKEAGVANGSLFTYFATKTDLFNELYLELKSEMAEASLLDLPAGDDRKKQMFHLWSNWMGWASAHPDKRRALALLTVSDDLTPATRTKGHMTMASIASMLETVRANGSMRDVPMGFVLGIMNAVADATIEFISTDPAHANEHGNAGFAALWRAIA